MEAAIAGGGAGARAIPAPRGTTIHRGSLVRGRRSSVVRGGVTSPVTQDVRGPGSTVWRETLRGWPRRCRIGSGASTERAASLLGRTPRPDEHTHHIREVSGLVWCGPSSSRRITSSANTTLAGVRSVSGTGRDSGCRGPFRTRSSLGRGACRQRPKDYLCPRPTVGWYHGTRHARGRGRPDSTGPARSPIDP